MKNNTKLIMETWRRYLKEGPQNEEMPEDGSVPQENEPPFDNNEPVEDEDLSIPYHDRYLDDVPEGYYDPDDEYADADAAYGKDEYADIDAEYDADDEPSYMYDQPELDSERDPEELEALRARKEEDLRRREEDTGEVDPADAMDELF